MKLKLTNKRLKKIICEEVKKILNEKKLARKVKEWELETALKKYGPDVVAVYVSLDIDMPIEKIPKKMKYVIKSLNDQGFSSPSETYEIGTSESIIALDNAIRDAGLSGPKSDKFRVVADKYY